MANNYIDIWEVDDELYEIHDSVARTHAEQNEGRIINLENEVAGIPEPPDAYEKDESDGRYASKADLLTKVGYAEVENGMLNLYADGTRARLLATVILPTGGGTGGGLAEAQVRAIIQSYGYTTNTGNYNKPSAGIPESDLEQGVREKLNSSSEKIRQGVEEYFRDNPIEGVTPEMVGAAVEEYLAGHGQPGVTTTQKNALKPFIRELALSMGTYGENIYREFCTAWGFTYDLDSEVEEPTEVISTTATLSTSGIVVNGDATTATLSSTGILVA